MDLSRRIIILIYGRAFSFLISLVIPIALTRLLLKEDYGSYQQLVMIYSIIQAILLLGIPQSLLYYYPRSEKEDYSILVKQTWNIAAYSAIFVILATWSGSELMNSMFPGHHLQPFIFLIGFYTGIMLLDIIVLPSAAWINPTTLGMMHGIITTAIVKAIVVLGYIYFNYLNKKQTGKTYYKEQLAYGIPVGLTAMIGIINLNVDKYMVAAFFSTSVFGVYYLGSLWAPIFGWIAQSMGQVITPRLSKAHKNNDLTEMQNLYNQSSEKLTFLFFPLTIFLILVAEPLILTMFTEKFEDAIPIFTIYMILLPTYPFRIGWILMASGQTKFLLRLAILMSTINILLSYYLITTLEGDNRLFGIPFATVTVTWLSMIIIMYQSLHTLKIKLKDAYAWKKIFTVTLISLLSAIPVIAILTFKLSSVIILLLSSITYGIVFLYISFRLQLWGESEINILKSFVYLKNS